MKPRDPVGLATAPASRNALIAMAGLLLVAATARVILLFLLPELWTLDSRSYLRIADKIARFGSFAEPQLGVLRMPGYPVLLALSSSMFGSSAAPLLCVQSGLGLLGTAAAFFLGLASSRALAGGVALGLFVGLNPVYLVAEHAIMNEALALTLGLVAAALASALIHRPGDLAGSTLLGLVVVGLVLTRLNAIVLAGMIALTAIVLPVLSRNSPVRPLRLRWAAACFAIGPVLLLTPWLFRNEQYLGQLSMFGSPQKMRLIYAIEAGLVDPSRALPPGEVDPSRFARDPAHVVFWKLVALGSREGERVAAALLSEARASNPSGFLRARARTAALFTGALAPSGTADAAMWLTHLHEPESRLVHSKHVAARFLAPTGSQASRSLVDALAKSVSVYTLWVRPVILLTGALAALWLLTRQRGWPNVPTVLHTLGVAYLGTVLLHAWTLADNSRFAMQFDWIPVTYLVAGSVSLLAGRPPSPTTPAGAERRAIGQDSKGPSHFAAAAPTSTIERVAS